MVEQILIALDQLLNALLGGYADETLSARAWRTQFSPLGGFFKGVIDFIFFWQPSHCYKSYLSEKQRNQLPVEYR
jgi:hypothetical protein